MSFSLSALSTAYAPGTPTRAFTATVTGAATVALSDGSAGGTFFPASLTLSAAGSKAFVYLPAPGATGNITLTATASGGTTGTATVALTAGTPTTLFADSFTGTAGTGIVAHASDSGGAWTKGWDGSGGSGAGALVLTDANALRMSGSVATEFDTNATIGAAADVDVFSTVKVFDRNTNGTLALMGRTPGGTAVLSGYGFFFYNETYGWALTCFVPDAGTQFLSSGQVLTPQPTTGGEMRMAFRMIDATQYIFLLYNGASICAPIQDSTYTSGRCGILGQVQSGYGSNTSGQHFDSFGISSPAQSSSPAPASFPFPNASIFQSPGSFRAAGASIISPTGAGYLKGKFSGTTTLALAIDTTVNPTLSANNMPAFRVVIDGGPPAYVQAAVGATQVVLKTGLSTGTHAYEIDFIGGNWTTTNTWSATGAETKVDALVLDNGATLSAPTLRSKRAFLAGDSYSQSYFGEPQTGPIYNYVDFTAGYGPQIAAAFDSEMGQQGIGGSGWVQPGGDGFFPAFPGWWDHFDATHVRTFPTLDYFFVLHGINDHDQSDAAVTAAVTAWIPLARAAMPGTKIFLVIPPNGQKRAAINAGKTAAGDANVFIVDLGDTLAQYIGFNGTATAYSLDGIHLTRAGQTTLEGPMIITATQASLITPAPTAGFAVTPASGAAPLTVSIADQSAHAASYLYDWGDGTADATTAAPTHTYTSAGTFTITQTVANPSGTATATHGVTVAAPPPGVPAPGQVLAGVVFVDSNGATRTGTLQPTTTGGSLTTEQAAQLAAILTQVQQLSPEQPISVYSPVAQDGSITMVRGYDMMASEGRQIDRLLPQTVAAGTPASLVLRAPAFGPVQTLTGTVVTIGGQSYARFEPGRADTAALRTTPPGAPGRYQVAVTMTNTHRVLEVTGALTITD